MSRVISRFVILSVTLSTSACFQASKFSNGNASDKSALPLEGEPTIDLPEDTTNGGGTGTGGGNTSSGTRVNGGWGDNDLRASSLYVLQKSCTSPAPANGGAACPNLAGWTVFNAGGYQLARQCTKGGTNGRMIPNNGENYFWCDPPAGYNHDGTGKLVNGGWGNNDLTATSAFVLQKSCTNPAPANGGARCPAITGWTVFDAGGYQLARSCTKGGKNGRMVLTNGENYFWCDPPDGFNNDGTAIVNIPAAAGYVANLTQYWPWPVDGTAFIKIFSREAGNPQVLIQKHIRSPDGTYQLIDVYYNPAKDKHEWHSTWHYRLDNDRGVIEFKDDFANVETQQLGGSSEFANGHELMHGKLVSKGTEVSNTLKSANGEPSYGSHMWFQVFEIFSKFYLLGKEYNNVVAMNMKQFFCPERECDTQPDRPGVTIYTHFYLAPEIGFVKQVYYNQHGNVVEGEANLVKYCTTSADKWSCD